NLRPRAPEARALSPELLARGTASLAQSGCVLDCAGRTVRPPWPGTGRSGSRVRRVRVSGRIVAMPLAEVFTIARGSQDVAEVVHVAIEHDGEVGWGEAAPIDRYDESVQSALAFVEEVELSDDPFALDETEARLAEQPGEHAAKAAIDAALHDLCGKLAGVPVWRLLGHRRAGPPTSWTIPLDDPDAMARKAERTGTPFRRLKL